jgi:hypothetical protein
MLVVEILQGAVLGADIIVDILLSLDELYLHNYYYS